MDKKVESKPGKKDYSKPQITQVKLVITEATLGICWTLNTAIPTSTTCQGVTCAT